jgi:hypothetical protein
MAVPETGITVAPGKGTNRPSYRRGGKKSAAMAGSADITSSGDLGCGRAAQATRWCWCTGAVQPAASKTKDLL